MPTLTQQRKVGACGATYSFTLLLRGANPLDHLDALFEAGCDDALFGERDGVWFAEFDRDAPSLVEAVGTAISQVESAVPAISVARVEPDELVSASEIAARTGRTRESVRLLIEHRRGPGDFPPPVCWINQRTRLWRWSDVAQWLAVALREDIARSDEATFIAALNAALELRTLTQRLSAPAARRTIDRLIMTKGQRSTA